MKKILDVLFLPMPAWVVALGLLMMVLFAFVIVEANIAATDPSAGLSIEEIILNHE